MREVEVVIVGAGPAGASCAWRLRQLGVECLLLDREPFPRDKLCGGLVTQEAARDLELRERDYPHGWLWIDRFYFHFRRWSLMLPSPQISIRRFEFDHWLAERSGVPLIRHEVREIRREDGGFVIDDRFRCRRLVGAGGSRCPVHRLLFRDLELRPRERQITALELEFVHPARDPHCHFWFFEDGFPGYYWYIPKAHGWLNIGVGALAQALKARQDNIWRHWQRFAERLIARGWLDAPPPRPGGHTYHLAGPTTAPVRDGAYLVGDSAGLATRDLGEGIRPAIESGLRAAEAIAGRAPYRLDRLERQSAKSLLRALLRRRWWR